MAELVSEVVDKTLTPPVTLLCSIECGLVELQSGTGVKWQKQQITEATDSSFSRTMEAFGKAAKLVVSTQMLPVFSIDGKTYGLLTLHGDVEGGRVAEVAELG